jgi:hypothetical protein
MTIPTALAGPRIKKFDDETNHDPEQPATPFGGKALSGLARPETMCPANAASSIRVRAHGWRIGQAPTRQLFASLVSRPQKGTTHERSAFRSDTNRGRGICQWTATSVLIMLPKKLRKAPCTGFDRDF